MGWKVRHYDEDAIGVGSNKPDYGSSNLFSLKIHYGGKFIKQFNSECPLIYVGGKSRFVDYVDVDELSLLELVNMVAEIGANIPGHLYFSTTSFDDCSQLTYLDRDIVVLGMNLINGTESCVGLYVDHDMMGPEELTSHLSEQQIGDTSKGTKFHVHEATMQDEVEVPTWITSPEEGYDSDAAISVGSDSDHDEFYEDSDGNYDLDDEIFEKYVDLDAEWVGAREKVLPSKRKGRNGKVKKVVVLEPIVRPYYLDEEREHKVPRHEGLQVFNPNVDLKKVKLSVGLCFTTLKDVRMALVNYAIQNRRDFVYVQNGAMKVQVRCTNDGCPWEVYISSTPEDATFILKTLKLPHNCPKLNKVSHATSTWLAETYGDMIRMNPTWPVDSMSDYFTDEVKLRFNVQTMYRAKKKALDKQTDEEQYRLLHTYAEEMMRSNPGTNVKITSKKLADQALFERIYICWNALKMGMLSGCRRVIFLDGCHIKTGYGGVILTAVGIDANNGLYPFAYAIVENERYDSWQWFLGLIKTDLEISEEHSYMWTLMSDKQKGLIEAVKAKLPNVEHRFCVYHLYDNFKLKFKGLSYKELIWRAAKATRPVDFELVMQELKELDETAYDWLASRDPTHWSKAFFRTTNNTDVVLNNISESFNSLLVKPRKMPIIKMLEAIRLLLMKRIATRRRNMLMYNGDLCPRIQQLVHENYDKSTKFTAHSNADNSYQVTYGANPTETKYLWAVNVSERTCNCRRWQLTGIPCAHAMSCFRESGINAVDMVNQCYTRETFLSIYDHYMQPINNMDEWVIPSSNPTSLAPPIMKTQPGRPKKYSRRKKPDEKVKKVPQPQGDKLSYHGRTMKCSNCKEPGHNKKGCPPSLRKASVANKNSDVGEDYSPNVDDVMMDDYFNIGESDNTHGVIFSTPPKGLQLQAKECTGKGKEKMIKDSIVVRKTWEISKQPEVNVPAKLLVKRRKLIEDTIAQEKQSHPKVKENKFVRSSTTLKKVGQGWFECSKGAPRVLSQPSRINQFAQKTNFDTSSSSQPTVLSRISASSTQNILQNVVHAEEEPMF